jgi:hypothetical protein
MAKLNKRNGAHPDASASDARGNVLTLRSDGAILRQFRIDSRLERAVTVATMKRGTDPVAYRMIFKRYAQERGYTIR